MSDLRRDWAMGLHQADVLRLLNDEATKQIAGAEISFTRFAGIMVAAFIYLVENTPERDPA